jgi:hypothetical protein
MYINDLSLAVSSCSIKLYAYADDTLIFFASKSAKDIKSKLTSDLNNLLRWFHSNCLILNVDKTKTMLIGTHQRLPTVGNFIVMAENISLTLVGTLASL